MENRPDTGTCVSCGSNLSSPKAELRKRKGRSNDKNTKYIRLGVNIFKTAVIAGYLVLVNVVTLFLGGRDILYAILSIILGAAAAACIFFADINILLSILRFPSQSKLHLKWRVLLFIGCIICVALSIKLIEIGGLGAMLPVVIKTLTGG